MFISMAVEMEKLQLAILYNKTDCFAVHANFLTSRKDQKSCSHFYKQLASYIAAVSSMQLELQLRFRVKFCSHRTCPTASQLQPHRQFWKNRANQVRSTVTKHIAIYSHLAIRSYVINNCRLAHVAMFYSQLFRSSCSLL